MLAVKVDNIFIGERKIYVNIPVFQKGKKIQFEDQYHHQGENVMNHPKPFNNGNIKYQANQEVNNSKSFAEVVGKKKIVPEGPSHISFSNAPIYLKFQCQKEVKEGLKKAYVGKMLFAGMSHNIQNIFHIEGYFRIKVIPLGANLCLLEEGDPREIKDFILEGRIWGSQWFSKIREWNVQDANLKKIV